MEHSQNRNTGAAGYLPILIITVIGIAYAAMGFFIPPLGDDLGFYHSFAAQNDCWYALPRSMYRHWIWNNARMADMLNPIGYNIMPLWAQAASNGLITALMFYVILKCSINKIYNKSFASLIIIFLVAFTMRWDAIWMEYATSYNYIWTTTFILLAVLLTKRTANHKAGLCDWLLIPFCFIAAAMHEAAGVPMAIGLIVSIITSGSYRQQNLPGKLMTLAFIAGGFFTLTSPASYSRIGGMLQPESPVLMMAFSAGYVLILAILIICLAIRNKKLLKSLLHSQWIAYVTAAFLSTGFMLISQYGGRTGWFAQVFALIAIFQAVDRLEIQINKKFANLLSILMCIIILFHYSALTYWQIRLGKEAREAISLYRQSSDGIIFMDYTDEPDLPWYLLRKTHGVPDEDDSYYRYRISKHYGKGRQLVILPEACRELDWGNFSGIQKFGERFISDKALSGSYGDMIVDIFPRTMVKIDGKEYIETPFNIHHRNLYLYSPVDRDRGEK